MISNWDGVVAQWFKGSITQKVRVRFPTRVTCVKPTQLTHSRNLLFQLLGGEVYHYHSKLTMKNAKGGGKFIWHQDYGYDLLHAAIPLSPHMFYCPWLCLLSQTCDLRGYSGLGWARLNRVLGNLTEYVSSQLESVIVAYNINHLLSDPATCLYCPPLTAEYNTYGQFWM